MASFPSIDDEIAVLERKALPNYPIDPLAEGQVQRFAKKSLIVFWLICFAAAACHSQSTLLAGNELLPNSTSVLTVKKNVQEVNLIVTVLDDRDCFVSNLTPAELTIQDNHQSPEKVTYFETRTNLPLRVALVIDSSDSVFYGFDFEKYSATKFLNDILRHDSDLGLVVWFNQQPQIAQGPTDSSELLSKAVQELHDGGQTSVYDAVALASRELGNIKDVLPSRRAMILMTDGDDNSSQLTLSQAAQASLQNESTVYVLDTSSIYSRSKRAERAMKQLAQLTGGEFLRVLDKQSIAKAFSKIEAELRSQYAIGYKPANTTPDGSYHHISVFTPKKLRVHHRQGYFAR